MCDIAEKWKCSSGKIVPGDQRNILRNNLQKLRCAVTKAIEYRKESNETHNEKMNLLKYDIMNGPYYVFGNHVNCAAYFCKKKMNKQIEIMFQILWNKVDFGLIFCQLEIY